MLYKNNKQASRDMKLFITNIKASRRLLTIKRPYLWDAKLSYASSRLIYESFKLMKSPPDTKFKSSNSLFLKNVILRFSRLLKMNFVVKDKSAAI